MANFEEPTEEEKRDWEKFKKLLPPRAQEVARLFSSWKLYKLRNTKYRVTIHGIGEDGSLAVNILGKFNRILFERRIFFVPPDLLEECEMPAEGEKLGACFSQEYAQENIRHIRTVVTALMGFDERKDWLERFEHGIDFEERWGKAWKPKFLN